MTTTPTIKPHPLDQIPQLIARARAAEDERDALARKIVELAKRLNREAPDATEDEASALPTRQLQRARADLAAARETIAALQRQLGAAQRLLAAAADDDAEVTRLRGAVEALTEQCRVLRLANRTLAGGGGVA